MKGLFGLTALVSLAGVAIVIEQSRKFEIPSHLLNHSVVYVPQLFDRATQEDLLGVLKNKARIPTNNADTLFYKAKHEHIGEAVPLTPDGKCEHKFLIPNNDRTLCTLPGRIDIALNYAKTGGFNGLKEPINKLFSRLLSFGVYLFDLETEEHKPLKKMMESPAFLDAAAQVCPPNKQYLSKLQFNFIVAIPGQTVATHVDGVYFEQASRFTFPQWLLAVMQFSGLFKDQFVDQVQVVGYVSDWDNENMKVAENAKRYGEFVYWADNQSVEGKRMPPLARSGNAVDGSKVVHSTTVYRPDVTPPLLDKDKKNELVYDQVSDSWALQSDNLTLGVYDNKALRISIVYRAHCFADESTANEFKRELKSQVNMLSLDDVLQRLVSHAEEAHGIQAPSLVNQPEARLKLALWLIEHYIVYPPPPQKEAFIPLNYCAILPAALAPYMCG